MDQLSKNEVKQIQLNMLQFIHEVCTKHGLRYFLNYGTLLGAVRHGGFIPWDDDIDISMPRKDYQEFVKVMETESQTKYQLLSYENSSWYFNNFMVLLDTDTVIPDIYKKKRKDTGVFIDIFPVDSFDHPKFLRPIRILNSLRRFSQYKKQYVFNHDQRWKDTIRVVLWYGLYFVNPRFFTRWIERIIKKNVKETGKYCGFIGFGDELEIFEADTFDELIPMQFEQLTCLAPKHYEKILTQLYGDYNQLPPEEEQQAPHGLEVYAKK